MSHLRLLGRNLRFNFFFKVLKFFNLSFYSKKGMKFLAVLKKFCLEISYVIIEICDFKGKQNWTFSCTFNKPKKSYLIIGFRIKIRHCFVFLTSKFAVLPISSMPVRKSCFFFVFNDYTKKTRLQIILGDSNTNSLHFIKRNRRY